MVEKSNNPQFIMSVFSFLVMIQRDSSRVETSYVRKLYDNMIYLTFKELRYGIILFFILYWIKKGGIDLETFIFVGFEVQYLHLYLIHYLADR